MELFFRIIPTLYQLYLTPNRANFLSKQQPDNPVRQLHTGNKTSQFQSLSFGNICKVYLLQ